MWILQKQTIRFYQQYREDGTDNINVDFTETDYECSTSKTTYTESQIKSKNIFYTKCRVKD
jgi:hypothetical protein